MTCNAQRRHLLGNSCYYILRISTENLLFSWWDARYHCKQVLGNQGDLVVLETKQEMFDLTILLRSHFGGKAKLLLNQIILHKIGNVQLYIINYLVSTLQIHTEFVQSWNIWLVHTLQQILCLHFVSDKIFNSFPFLYIYM